MADYAIIVAGFDPTSLGGTAPNNSQLLQMVQEAQFADDVGGIIYAQAAPDVVAYPILKRFRWGELNGSNQRTGKFYYYKDSVSAWTLETPADGTINGSAFIDGTIAVTKLAPGTAAYLLRTNGAGTAAEWAPVATAIPDGSLSLAKLTSGVALPDYIIRTDGAGQFIAQLFTTYLESLFALDKYVPFSTLYEDGAGTENQALFINNASPRKGLTAAWVEDKLRANQTATSKLNLGGTANALKIPQVNATGADFQYITVSALIRNRVFAKNSISNADTLDLVLTKPAGTTWAAIRFDVSGFIQAPPGQFSSIGLTATWQTGSLTGAALSADASTNLAFKFEDLVNNHPEQGENNTVVWWWDGNVPDALQSEASITIRLTFAWNAGFSRSAYASAAGYYV